MKGGDLDNEVREASVKLKGQPVRILDLVFDGSEDLGLTDKKMILVEPFPISVIAK